MSSPVDQTSSTQPTTHIVQTDGGVQAAARQISTLPLVSLDTEFHAERRFHPEIMLLQVASPSGEVWVADPRECEIGPIIRAVSTRRVIVHAGQEDMAILHREAQTSPAEVLDVQIAAGMVGLGYPTRLMDLCESLLGHPIDKGATLSNWAQRPLTEAQIRYASQDVRVLHELVQVLEQRLVSHGRTPWANEASSEMARKATRAHTTSHTWVNWEIAVAFDERTRRTLTAIFDWRDARGRDKDQPPHFMLGDGIALDIARRQPRTVEALQANRRIPAGLIRRYGEDLVKVVLEADNPTIEMVDVPTTEERTLAHALQLWATLQEPITGLAAKLVMPRSVALDVARLGDEGLIGWRAEAIGPALSTFLSGEVGLRMGAKGLTVK